MKIYRRRCDDCNKLLKVAEEYLENGLRVVKLKCPKCERVYIFKERRKR
jgi:phage FluMu protein Com